MKTPSQKPSARTVIMMILLIIVLSPVLVTFLAVEEIRHIRKISFLLPPAKVPKFICKFLDEEQMSHLIDYRISWYFQKPRSRWTNLKVLIKTYHFVLVEVLLTKSIDKITQFFKSGIPRI